METNETSAADIALEREKLQLERERLALERDRLESERDSWRIEMEATKRASKRMITPVNLVLAMLASLLVGALIGIGVSELHRNSRAERVIEALGGTNGVSPGELLLLY